MPDKRKAVIVAGLRTPFAKENTAYRHLSALDLGALVCRELVERVDLDPEVLDQVVYGQVIPSLDAPNIAMRRGAQKQFVCSGIQTALEHYRRRGYRVRGHGRHHGDHWYDRWDDRGNHDVVCFSPSVAQ